MKLIPESLALYKKRPVLVRSIGEKITIEEESGEQRYVRPKDILLLHSGPIKSLKDISISPSIADVEGAWEIFVDEEESPDIETLADLVFAETSPKSLYAATLLLNTTPYFKGSPDSIIVRNRNDVEAEIKKREEEKRDKEEWASFMGRLNKRKLEEGDTRFLSDLELLATGRSTVSRILKKLNKESSPENAHRFLLELGVWEETKNPYPNRFELRFDTPGFELPPLPNEKRLDLTSLESYAVDDEESDDPDDAISFTQEGLWVHVADCAALVSTDSKADEEAALRGSSVYLPEGKIPMLPDDAVKRLGLGLTEISPALSFLLTTDSNGCPRLLKVTPSLIRVQRISYTQMDALLDQEPFASIRGITGAHALYRKENGGVSFDIPEVRISVSSDKRVSLSPLKGGEAREIIARAMIFAGEAVAHFAEENHIPIPFFSQTPPESSFPPPSLLSEMFAVRKKMQAARMSLTSGEHSGLGVRMYTRVTSPLRRYSDLIVHRQLRAFLAKTPLMDEETLKIRLSTMEAGVSRVNAADRASVRFWKTVFLKQNPRWEGKGIHVEKREKKSLFFIPELSLETLVPIKNEIPIDGEATLRLVSCDIPSGEAIFKEVH